MQVRVAGLEPESITDGPGFRFALFTQGCSHHCPGCHNPETWSYEGGEVVTVEELFSEYQAGRLLRGVTFSGGEPFDQAGPLAVLGQLVHEQGGDVLVYTGYLLEDLEEKAKQDPDIGALLEVADRLIDGPFVLAERDLSLLYRGSRNQRLFKKVQGSWQAWEPDGWD